MLSPEWQFADVIERRIRVIKVNRRQRHLDAQNIDDGVPLYLEVQEGFLLEKIKSAKIYRAKIRVFVAELSGELERQLSEFAIEDVKLRYSLHVMKSQGGKLTKYELLSIK